MTLSPEYFIPLLLATAGLAYASFRVNKTNKSWLILSFVIWLMAFVMTFWWNKIL